MTVMRMPSWDERYGAEEYVYGTEPSPWLMAQAPRIQPGGRVLSLGEGEGRNAVWLAQRGFSVLAVDGSSVGLAKARRLAATRGVEITTVVADLETWAPPVGGFDAVLLMYLHLPFTVRRHVHTMAWTSLRPGGIVILEAFTPRQLAYSSGGPKQVDMLYEPAVLRDDFPGVTWDVLEEIETDIDEGPLHRGRAALVRAVGERRPIR